MAHYRLLDRLPSAIVTAGGSEKKVYEENTVFFNKGDNFELRFFNPLREKIGVEIIFNGQKKSDGLLVVNPGEDISLDRFLDDKKKMIFDTYHIDSNNAAAVAAAELNGDVIVNFYKEKHTSYYSQSYYYGGPGTYGTGGSGTSGACGNTGTSGSSGTGGIPGNFTTLDQKNRNSRMYNTNTTNISSAGINIQQDYWFPSGEGIVNLDSLCCESTSEIDLNEYSKSKSLTETGRVEKGETSNQNLNLVDIEFESKPFHSIHYNLKPTSTKGYTRATEIRNYCPECGYRVRKETWKFCPKCGENLI